jgi:hypothetical protein
MPGNIARLFTQHLPHPAHVLYRHSPEDAWMDVTVREVAALAGRWQAAFRREGYVAGDRIAVCARNGINWVAIDIAVLGPGLVIVPLTSTPTRTALRGAWTTRRRASSSSRIRALQLRLRRAHATHPRPPLLVLNSSGRCCYSASRGRSRPRTATRRRFVMQRPVA